MIDTDKYDLGHAVGKWRVRVRKGTFTVKDCLGDEVAAVNDYADAQLIADAPLILADYKRLQERLDWILGDEELASYVWEKEVAYMEWEGVRLPWISADEWGEEE